MNRALTSSLTALCISGLIALPALADESAASDASISNGRITDTSTSSSTNTADATASNTTSTAGTAETKAAIADKSGVDSSTSTDAANSSATGDNGSTVNTDKKAIADNAPGAAPASDPKKDPTAAKGAKPGAKGGNVSIPTRAAAFTAGVVVGTPIAILRRTHIEILQGEKDLIGDYDTWWKKALFVFPGALMSVPFGGVSGGLGGCMYSVKNAWAGSRDEPFGKDSFSLGDVGN